jgi:hypothetical protein
LGCPEPLPAYTAILSRWTEQWDEAFPVMEEAELYEEWIENRRQLKQTVRAMKKLSRQVSKRGAQASTPAPDAP